MPDISKLINSRGKRIDASAHFGEGAFITLVPLKKAEKKRIQLLSMSSAMVTITKKIMDSQDIDKTIDNQEIGRLFLEMTEDEREAAARVTNEIESIYLENGVHKTDHNLLKDDGTHYELDTDFWEYFPEASQWVIESCKVYNSGNILGEPS